MNFITEMDNIIADFYRSTDEIIKKAKSTGKEGKRGKGDTTHCSPSTLNLRPTLQPIEKLDLSEYVGFVGEAPINSNMEVGYQLKRLELKLNQLIDRINLLSIKNKL